MWKLLSGLMCLALMGCAVQAGEADLGCPVAKPVPIPDELQRTFAVPPDVTLEEQLKELQKLMEGRRDEECSKALRWLMYQLDRPVALREAAIKVLADWNTSWLFYDVDFLANSEVQSPEFRTVAVQMLGLIHRYYPALDKKTYDALSAKAGSDKPFLRDPALLVLAEVASEYLWRANHAERIQALVQQWRVAVTGASVESLKVLLRAAAAGELVEVAPQVEAIAADAQQPVELRAEALRALQSVARPGSLAILDAIAKEDLAGLREGLASARPYVLVACLASPTKELKASAFKELLALGPSAEGALIKALDGEKDDRQLLVKTILTGAVVSKHGLKPIDHSSMKRFGENAEKKQQGLATLLIDKNTKTILVEGEFVLESGPLEYMVVGKGENAKLHETILAVYPSPTNLCLAMLLCAYEFVGEVRRDGKVNMPKGGGVMLSVEYERSVITPDGETKERVRLPIEAFAWNNTTEQPMKRCPWAFTGSRWETSEDGKRFLRAEIEKSVAAIMVDPDALLNTPLDSAEDANVGGDRFGFYSINRKIIPPKGTVCWLVFEPYAGKALSDQDVHDKGEKVRPMPPQGLPGTEAGEEGNEDRGPPPISKHPSTRAADENENE